MSTGTWIPLGEAKTQAHDTQKLLMVEVASMKTCSYCKAAEFAIFQNQAWIAYAQAQGLVQARVEVTDKTMKVVDKALNKEYKTPSFPTFLLFMVKPEADLKTLALDKKNNVDFKGKFVYRKGTTVNKIKITTTVPNFIKVLESFAV
jgi:hypothetical protein